MAKCECHNQLGDVFVAGAAANLAGDDGMIKVGHIMGLNPMLCCI